MRGVLESYVPETVITAQSVGRFEPPVKVIILVVDCWALLWLLRVAVAGLKSNELPPSSLFINNVNKGDNNEKYCFWFRNTYQHNSKISLD